MSESSNSSQKLSSTERTRLIVGAVIVILLVWFAVANRNRVRIDFILFDRHTRVIYAIIVSAVLGAVADRLILRRRRGNKDGR